MRTMLGRNVKKAASIAKEAHERNVPVDQVISERLEKSITRREFLQGTAMLAAVATVPSLLWNVGSALAKGDEDKRIVVVGAGLAGLTCAYRLKQKGIRADVYEASKRVGGRCYSRRGDFAEGQVAEHGGELIDTEHMEIRQLAAELGLTLDDMYQAEGTDTEDLYYIANAPYTLQEMSADLKAIWPVLQKDAEDAGDVYYNSFTQRAWELDNLSVADYIEQIVPGGLDSRLGKLLEVAFTANNASEIWQQSALGLIYTMTSPPNPDDFSLTGSSDERYHVRGGNDQIATRMAAKLEGQIRTEHELTAIERTANGRYQLTFRNGPGKKKVTADQVVLALPFSILRASVDFSKAGFSKLKMRAIREMGFGACSKLNLQFTDRHWRDLKKTGASYADAGFQTTWEVTRGQPGSSGILVNYTGGDYARSFGYGTAAERAEELLDKIEPLFPGVKQKWNGKATVDNWAGYQWTKGAFSYYGVGQYTAFYGVAAEPEGNCFFAGEHTALNYYGFLNGAVESAHRAVTQILATHKSVAHG